MISTDLRIRGCAGHSVVILSGELDLQDAPYLTAVLLALAEREPRIVADLTGLEFIDSSGAAALACGREQARRAGGDLLLAAPGRQVARMLGATRRAHGFSVHASVEEAAGSISRRRGAVVVALPGRPPVPTSTGPEVPAVSAPTVPASSLAAAPSPRPLTVAVSPSAAAPPRALTAAD